MFVQSFRVTLELGYKQIDCTLYKLQFFVFYTRTFFVAFYCSSKISSLLNFSSECYRKHELLNKPYAENTQQYTIHIFIRNELYLKKLIRNTDSEKESLPYSTSNIRLTKTQQRMSQSS